jgi:sugar phosphate isomerase/epimerase
VDVDMEQWSIHPRVSVNPISSMNWTLEQDVAFYRSVGVHTIGIPHFKFSNREAEGVAKIREAGFRCATLSTGGGSLIDSGEQSLANLRGAIEVAAALNCPSLYTVSGATPPRMTTDDAYARLVETLQPANAYAKSKGVRLGIEHTAVVTRAHGFVHTLADAVDLSRDADIGICVELQNCWYERNLQRLFRENVERFVVVQVSDFAVGEELRYNRRVPGDGSMPLEWMLGALLEAGYGGYFDLEILGPAVEAEGYESAIRRSVDWMTERLNAWGV